MRERLRATLSAWWAQPKERGFALALALLVVVGAWTRAGGLSRGSLFRDDAWVALTSRVPLGTAWHMVGTAPLFTLVVRWWTGLTYPSTLLAQFPIFLMSVIGLIVVALVARYFGLSRTATLFVTALLVVARTDVQYATHLKPYAHDVVAGAVMLAAARWWQRGGNAWWFAGVSALCVLTSFSVVPLLAGVSLYLAIVAVRSGRWRELVLPGLGVGAPVVAVVLSTQQGISPRLDQSWQASYLSYHSLGSFARSLGAVTQNLVWGFGDTTPGFHVPLYGHLFTLAVVTLVVFGVALRSDAALPLAAVAGAYVASALHLAPLGTGRTDAYLHPALALLAGLGLQGALRLVQQRHVRGRTALLILTSLFLSVAVADRVAHRPSYPGGSITPVLRAATDVRNAGGAVLIEGTARWPWTYYETPKVQVFFSSLYNTGFAPRSTEPHVVVMPGTMIEGNYQPSVAVAKLNLAPTVLYVRTDDWPAMGDPLGASLRSAGYCVTSTRHVPGYLLETVRRNCSN